MAQVTAALIKQLRDRTGAGMTDCKKALVAVDGDLDKAAEKLRMDGAAKADKKAARTAAEGMIAVSQNADAIALVEVNCETDFVAKGDDFRGFARLTADAALANKPADAEALLTLEVEGQSIEQRRRELVAKTGENLSVRRVSVVASGGGALVTYIHPGDRIAVALAMKSGDEELARDLAMHAAAMSPRFLDADSVPQDQIESERKIIQAQIAEQAQGKPPEIVDKMVSGKLRKFLAEITLLGQPFVKEPDQTVEKLLKANNAAVAQFVRLAVGEGIERKQADFAAEVAAATQV
ncbi:MAG: translation elongation factor Ts [Panacagrimonas sp.]